MITRRIWLLGIVTFVCLKGGLTQEEEPDTPIQVKIPLTGKVNKLIKTLSKKKEGGEAQIPSAPDPESPANPDEAAANPDDAVANPDDAPKDKTKDEPKVESNSKEVDHGLFWKIGNLVGKISHILVPYKDSVRLKKVHTKDDLGLHLPPYRKPKQTSKAKSKGKSKKKSKGKSKKKLKDKSKDKSKDKAKDKSEDKSKDISKGKSKSVSKTKAIKQRRKLEDMAILKMLTRRHKHKGPKGKVGAKRKNKLKQKKKNHKKVSKAQKHRQASPSKHKKKSKKAKWKSFLRKLKSKKPHHKARKHRTMKTHKRKRKSDIKKAHTKRHKKPHTKRHTKHHNKLSMKPHKKPHKKTNRKPYTKSHIKPHKKPHMKPHKKSHKKPNKKLHKKPHKKPLQKPHKKPHTKPHKKPLMRPHSKSHDLSKMKRPHHKPHKKSHNKPLTRHHSKSHDHSKMKKSHHKPHQKPHHKSHHKPQTPYKKLPKQEKKSPLKPVTPLIKKHGTKSGVKTSAIQNADRPICRHNRAVPLPSPGALTYTIYRNLRIKKLVASKAADGSKFFKFRELMGADRGMNRESAVEIDIGRKKKLAAIIVRPVKVNEGNLVHNGMLTAFTLKYLTVDDRWRFVHQHGIRRPRRKPRVFTTKTMSNTTNVSVAVLTKPITTAAIRMYPEDWVYRPWTSITLVFCTKI